MSDDHKPTKPVSAARSLHLPDKFLVAFSFAGEQRDRVRAIAEAVEAKLGPGTVFLDEWFEHYLAGADADLKLQSIYGERSELVVVCVSERYGNKPWTLAEHEAIRARLMRARASADEREMHRMLPIRVGDGDVKGIHFNTIVPDVRDRTPEASADLILARLSLVTGSLDLGRGPVPTVQPSSARRRHALQKQLELLTAQWQAALEESAMSSGAAQIRADQQAASLEQRIVEIERRLAGDG